MVKVNFNRMKGLDQFWYILYIIANIFSFGSLWFMRNLISYSIRMSK